MMNDNTLRIEVHDDAFVDAIDTKAEQHGITRTEYAIKALELLNGFDVALFKQIESYAARFDVPPWLVIQNIIIKRFALDAAESEVLGDNTTLLREFCESDMGPITVNDLYDTLKQTYIHDLEMKRFERIMEFKTNGWDLSDEDISFLEKYHNHKK
jgi:hypothetical protein